MLAWLDILFLTLSVDCVSVRKDEKIEGREYVNEVQIR